jgi:gamma-glutamyltranspeptidase
MKLGDMVDTPSYTDEEIQTQLTQPTTLTNLLTTLKDFDLKDLQMTTFPDLRLIIEASTILAARAQTLHDKRLKRTLQ